MRQNRKSTSFEILNFRLFRVEISSVGKTTNDPHIRTSSRVVGNVNTPKKKKKTSRHLSQ